MNFCIARSYCPFIPAPRMLDHLNVTTFPGGGIIGFRSGDSWPDVPVFLSQMNQIPFDIPL